jgi:hypothetical protein
MDEKSPNLVTLDQGCQMAYFQIKNPSLSKFWRCLSMEDVGIFHGYLVCFTAIWSVLLPFGIFYCHLVYFVAIWYILWSFGVPIFSRFGMLRKEKSGNPAPDSNEFKLSFC